MGSYVAFVCILAPAIVPAFARYTPWNDFRTGLPSVLLTTQTLADITNLIQPRHCGDLRRTGQTTSRVYNVFHRAASPAGQKVYCDMDSDGGGWTVIVRRGQFGNNVFYFNRNWTEYASGFGDPEKEYWIGNRALHALTSGDETMMLRVVLSNTTEETISLDYSSVLIESENENFKIHIGTFQGPQGWDSLSNYTGMMFSTFDRDNDRRANSSCAVTFPGGWWYKSCYTANLNGLNLNGHCSGNIGAIDWMNQGGARVFTHSYPNALMLIRPASFNPR